MSMDGVTAWYHSNRYNAQIACSHCKGVIRHEPWCLSVAPLVSYAYDIIANAAKLTKGDAIILHSLGIIWSDCQLS